MKPILKIIIILALLALRNTSLADELLVPSQYSTIQSAIDAAANGDTVIVAPGTYTGPGNRDIDFLGKAITVRSQSGPDDCIIDCQRHTGFDFHNGEDTNSILDSFTITNGSAHMGGAILCFYSSPKIVDCLITGNSASSDGAIYCRSSHPEIIDCNITANSGTGIYCRDSNALITGCKITGNSGYLGGGIISEGTGKPVITNCTITGNSAIANYDFSGGGIYCLDAEISDCNISGNSAPRGGGGIGCLGGTITNCTITDNTGCGIYFFRMPVGSGDTIIKNCTIQGNSGCGISGGTGPITNCIITGNSGGGIAGGRAGCTGPITDCNITGNSVTVQRGPGGGGGLSRCSGPITNCIISRNSAAGSDSCGGGLFDCEGPVSNCTITGNSAGRYGGGINLLGGSINMANCTISGNSAGYYGGGLYTCGHIINLTNCIFWANTDSSGQGESAQVCFGCLMYGYGYGMNINYCCIQGWTGESGGNGNIDSDPCFIELGCWVDVNDPNIIVEPNDPNAVWLDGDYHLLFDSPCIDSGDPNYIPEPNTTDLDGNPRINGGRIDMGAYESVYKQARLWISPQIINRRNPLPRMITAWMYLPAGINKEQVDEDTPLVLYPGGIKAKRQAVFQNRGWFDRRTRVLAFFDSDEFLDAVDTTGTVKLIVVGHLLAPGQYFFGSDSIRIMSPKHPPHWH